MSRVLAKKESGKGHLETGAAEGGLVHLNVAAIAVHYLGHHGEADTLAGGAIGAHPALEDKPGFAGGDAGAVILHHDEQAALLTQHRHLDLADGKFAGVVEQVAHHLHQIALLAIEENIVIEAEVGLQLLVAIDLGQARQQLFDERHRLSALAGETLAAGDGTTQLVLDDLIHGGDLFIDVVVHCVAQLELLRRDLDKGQPSFQTVGQIVQGVLIALGLLALVFQQLVDGFGQRRQLPLVVLGERLPRAGTDLVYLPRHGAQGRETPEAGEQQQGAEQAVGEQGLANAPVEIVPGLGLVALGGIDHHHVVGRGAVAVVAQEAQAVDEVALAILDGVQLEEIVLIQSPKVLHQIPADGLLDGDHLGHVQAGPAQLSIGAADQGVEIGVDGIRGQAAEIRDGVGLRLLGGEQLGEVLLHADAGFLGLLLGVAEVEDIDGEGHDERDDQHGAHHQLEVQRAMDQCHGVQHGKGHQLQERLKM